MVFPFMMLTTGIGLPLGVKIMNLLGGPRKTGMVGCTLIAACVFIASYVNVFWAFTLFYGIFVGFISGVLYMMPIYIGYIFFP